VYENKKKMCQFNSYSEFRNMLNAVSTRWDKNLEVGFIVVHYHKEGFVRVIHRLIDNESAF
jgi:hypothetical protein